MLFPLRKLLAVLAGVWLLLVAPASLFAQFSGSILLGGNSSSNLSGTDTAKPDRAFAPTIDLQYKLPVSEMVSFTLQGAYNPNLYTVTPANSFTKIDLDLNGDIYFSRDEPPMPTPAVIRSSPETKKDTNQKITQSVKPPPTALDSVSLVGTILAALSERLDAVDIDTTGISNDEDSIDDSSDLKDSLSESVLAVSEVISEQAFSESIQSVLLDELSNDLLLLKQIPLTKTLSDSINDVISSLRGILQRTYAKSDVLPMPSGPIEAVTSTKVIQKLESKGLEVRPEAPAEDAPLETLVDPETDLVQFSTQDITLKEDIQPKTPFTLATLLHIPGQIEQQTNQPLYKAYSYTEYSLLPRISFYPSKNIGLGAMYGYTDYVAPNDTIFTFIENRIRLDGRVAIGSFLVLSTQLGESYRNYPSPPVTYDTVKLTGGRKRITATIGREFFSQTQYGLNTSFFPSSRLVLGVGYSLTNAPNLRSYLIDNTLGRSKIGGQASDDPFSYDLSRLFFYCNSRIVWDMNFNVDLALENRKYGAGVNRKLSTAAQAKLTRTDKGDIVTVDLNRDFLLDNRLFSIFDGITPELNVQYTKYASTIKLYEYHDVTTTLSVNFAF